MHDDNLPSTFDGSGDRFYHYLNKEDGRIHKIDKLTGMTVEISAPKGTSSSRYDINPTFVKNSSSIYPYSPVYRDLVSQKIAEGLTFTEISRIPGYPSTSIMSRWRAQHEDFDLAIKAARKARAEHYADKIANSVDETREMNRDEIAAEKLYFDKLKWLAEKNNPDEYGSKITHAGDADRPLTLVVETGIVRDKQVRIEQNSDDIVIGESDESN